MAGNPDDHENLILVFVLRHLRTHNFTETAHCLERESGFYFHMQYFEELIMTGRYDEAEEYVLGFTSVEESRQSARLIFYIKKLRLLEAMHSGARHYARDIVNNEFPQFTVYNDKIYDLGMALVSMANYRDHEAMKRYEEPETRRRVVEEMKRCIRENPAFEGKLELPSIHTMLQRLMEGREGNGVVGGFFPIFRNHWNRHHGNN